MSAIFKSRQVNLDPEPYVDPATGERFDRLFVKLNGTPITTHDPRPEFEPTRDSHPWLCDYEIDGKPCRSFFDGHGRYTWAPRREQFDTPVNRVLEDVRRYRSERLTMNNPKGWGRVLSAFASTVDANPWDATADEIEHASKVLTRLAGWSA